MTEPVLALDVVQSIVAPTVSGVIQGCVYGLLGLGIVLLYKSTKVFNFAQAEFGATAAFVTLLLDRGTGLLPDLPFLLAALVGLGVGVLIGLATERFVVRPLSGSPKVIIVVATAGVTLLLIAVQSAIVGADSGAFPAVFDGVLFEAGAVRITAQQAVVVVVLAVLSAAAAALFSRTRTGTAVLAVSQEPTATSLVGISTARISMLVWGIAGLLAGFAGILVAGSSTIYSPGSLTALALVPALTAAVFGGITSLPGAVLGGIVIGVVQALAQANLDSESLPGAERVVLFALLLVVLLIRPRGLLGKEV